MLAQSILRRLIFAGVFALTATVSRGASEIVIAIRYLQPKGTSPSGSPAPPPQQEFASPSGPAESAGRPEHPSVTALDATANAQDRPPQNIKAPDAASEIFWRKGEDKEDPLDWIMWFRDSKSGHETKIGKLRGFPSFEPLRIGQNKDGQFLFDGPLRLVFFSCHLNSSGELFLHRTLGRDY